MREDYYSLYMVEGALEFHLKELHAGDLMIIPPRAACRYVRSSTPAPTAGVRAAGRAAPGVLPARRRCFEAESCGLLSVLLSRPRCLLPSQASLSRLQTSLEYIHRRCAKPLTVQVLADVQSAALKKDGSIWVWGHNKYFQLCDGSNADSLSLKQVVTH